MSTPAPLSPQEEALLKAVRSLDFGSVEVIVHDKRIVEVQQKRKVRFPGNPAPTPSSKP
jgi:hypothetical protein